MAIATNFRAWKPINPADFRRLPVKVRYPVSVFLAGLKCQKNFDHIRAVRQFDESLRRDPTFVLAAYEKSWSHLALGEFEPAGEALRAVIVGAGNLSGNYEAVAPFDLYREDTCPDQEFLFGLYDTVAIFGALVLLATDEKGGRAALRGYLRDLAIPEERKSRKVITGLLKEREGMVIVRKRVIAYDADRIFTFSLISALLNIEQYVFGTFEADEDYLAMEKLMQAQIEIARRFSGQDPHLLELKRHFQKHLALVYITVSDKERSVALLEEVLAEDPADDNAAEMLAKAQAIAVN